MATNKRQSDNGHGRRLAWALPLAVAVALGLFVLCVQLISVDQKRLASQPQTVVKVPAALTELQPRIVENAAHAKRHKRLSNGLKSAGHIRGGTTQRAKVMPPMSLAPGRNGLPSAAVRRVALDMGGVRARLARQAVGTALAAVTPHMGAGWGVKKWLGGPVGLYDLPDSGLHVTQLQGRCPDFRGMPPTGAVTITAVVDTHGHVGNIPFSRQESIRAATGADQSRDEAMAIPGSASGRQVDAVSDLHPL